MLARFRSKSLRRRAALFALFSFLISTAAIASYLCPDLAAPTAPMKATLTAQTDQHPCSDIEQTQPQLCLEHCQYTSKSADTTSPLYPLLGATVLILLCIVTRSADRSQKASISPTLLLLRLLEPPLFLRHCRYTI